VTSTYLTFWNVSAQAEKTGNAAAAQAVLAPYVSPTYINYMISQMQTAWAKNEIAWGHSVEHIQSVTVVPLTGQAAGELTAVVKDCQDDSGSGLASAQTGDLIPGTLGESQLELYTSLNKVANGQWLIDQVTEVSNSCAA